MGVARDMGGTLFPTVTGMLLIGKVESIKRFVPTEAAVFQVLEGTNTRINDDFVLPILAAIERIDNYLVAWNPETEIEMGLFRMSVSDFHNMVMESR